MGVIKNNKITFREVVQVVLVVAAFIPSMFPGFGEVVGKWYKWFGQTQPSLPVGTAAATMVPPARPRSGGAEPGPGSRPKHRDVE